MTNERVEDANNGGKKLSLFKSWQTWFHDSSSSSSNEASGNRVNKKGFFFWVSSYLRKLNKKLPEDVNGKKEFVVQQFQGAENNKLRQKRTWRESAGNDDELLDQRMNNIGQGDHEAREQRPVNYPDHHPQHQNQQQRHHIIHQHDEDALLQQKPRRVPFHLPSCPGRRCRLCLAGTIASVSHVKHVPGITDTEHWAKGRVKFAPVAIGSDSQAALDAQEWMDRGSETLVRRSSDRVACYSPRKRRKLMEPFAENENVGMEDETPQMIPENASRSTAVHHDLITHHHQHHQQQQPEEDALASGMTLRNIYGPHSSGFGIPSPFTTHNRLTGFERRHAQIGELMGLSANYIFNNNQDLNEVLQTRDRMEAGEFLVDLVGQTQDRFQAGGSRHTLNPEHLAETRCLRGGSGSAKQAGNCQDDDTQVNKLKPSSRGLVAASTSLTGIAEPMQNWSGVESQENFLVNEYARGADIMGSAPPSIQPTATILEKPKLKTEGMVVTAALRLARKRSIVNLMRGDCNEFFPAGEDLGKLDTSEPEDEELIVYTRCKRQERHRGHNKHKCQDKVDDADVKVSELSEDENAPDMKPNVPEEKK